MSSLISPANTSSHAFSTKPKHLPVSVKSAFSVKKFLPWKQLQKSKSDSVKSAFSVRKLLPQEQVQWKSLCSSSVSQAGAQWEAVTEEHCTHGFTQTFYLHKGPKIYLDWFFFRN